MKEIGTKPMTELARLINTAEQVIDLKLVRDEDIPTLEMILNDTILKFIKEKE